MKKILLILTIASLFSCNEHEEEIKQNRLKDVNDFQKVIYSIDKSSYREVRIMTIDSCEYIVWDGSHGEFGFAHKGNCKNHN